MVTAASVSDLAIVLIDATKGIQTQTKRHCYILSLMGLKRIIFAVNKMDLINFDQQQYNNLVEQFSSLNTSYQFDEITYIPMSALLGDHISLVSSNMPWYSGPTLLEHLDNIQIRSSQPKTEPFRMFIQWVSRTKEHTRAYSGQILSGLVKKNQLVTIFPGGQKTSISKILSIHGEQSSASKGQPAMIAFNDQVDGSRGSIIYSDEKSCKIGKHFLSTVIWLSDVSLINGRQYILKLGSLSALCSVTKIEHRIDINTMKKKSCKKLKLNEIGYCHISLDHNIPYLPYKENHELGAFILIDRMTKDTLAAGLIEKENCHTKNLFIHKETIDMTMRASLKEQQPLVLWFTGLSGSGKSTLANLLEHELYIQGKHTMLLDGDNIRHGLNIDLDFSTNGRVENIRRIAEVAKLMRDAGLITLVSFISPFATERRMAKELIGKRYFKEIFVDAPFDILEKRDPKGLYQKARKGLINNFTGIDSPYETPINPDLKIDTSLETPEEGINAILSLLDL